MTKGKQILGITISLSFLSLLAVTIFLEALRIKYRDFFTSYVDAILLTSGFAILFFVATGTISIGKILNKK